MFENGFFNLAVGLAIFWAIMANARIRNIKGIFPYAPEILIAIYSLALGFTVIFFSSSARFHDWIQNTVVMLVFLPFACVLGADSERHEESGGKTAKWLVAAAVLLLIYGFLDEGIRNFGYGSFISDSVITLFFGFGLLRFAGFQRLILLLATVVWGSLHLSAPMAIPSGISFGLALAAFIKVAFVGNSTVFDNFEFSAEDFVLSNVYPFIILDLSGRIEFTSREFAAFSGFSAAELKNTEAIELFDIPSNWMMKVNPQDADKKVSCHLQARDGSRIPILLWLNEIRKNNKKLVNLICFIHDESEHQGMRDKLNEESRRFSGLHETSKALSSSLEMRHVLQAITEAAETLTDSDTCTVFALDHSRQMIKALYSTEEVYSDEVMNFEFPVGQGLTGRAVGEGKPLMQNFDDENDLAVLIPGTSDDQESMLSAPLLAKNVVIGALTLYKTGNKRFNKENLETLTVFASQAASALETSRLYMKLKESEKVYRASVDLAGDGIMFVSSETGKITDANETMREMLDYSRAEIVSKFVWDLHPQPQMQLARQLWQAVRANGKEVLSEILYETGNKKLIPASVNASTIATGDINFIQWVVRDMSEYKRTIDKMAFFQDVFQGLDEPAMITDSKGMVCFINQAMRSYVSADCQAFDSPDAARLSLRSLGLPVLEELWEEVRGKTGLARRITFNGNRQNQIVRDAHILATFGSGSNLTHHVWLLHGADQDIGAPRRDYAERA